MSCFPSCMIRLIQCREHQNVGVESFIGYPDDPNGGTERNGAVLGYMTENTVGWEGNYFSENQES